MKNCCKNAKGNRGKLDNFRQNMEERLIRKVVFAGFFKDKPQIVIIKTAIFLLICPCLALICPDFIENQGSQNPDS